MAAACCILAVPVIAMGAFADAFAGNQYFEETGAEAHQQPINSSEDDAARVLAHPRIRLSPGARADVEERIVDHRVLRVLLLLADRHYLGWVGPIRRGHSYFVRGTTRASNHAFARAVDISVIDGRPVSYSNEGARQAVDELLSLPAPYRPDEVGSPWATPAPGVATFQKDHHDHIHFGYRR